MVFLIHQKKSASSSSFLWDLSEKSIGKYHMERLKWKEALSFLNVYPTGTFINNIYIFGGVATLLSLWDLRSLIGELTQALGSENAESHHQTIREFPNNTSKKKML